MELHFDQVLVEQLCSAGVAAQIQGHKPSATIERHYIVRPMDMLRQHHERIEQWILESAGIK